MHVSPVSDEISTKFQLLCLCFRGLAFHWDIRVDYATQPEVEKSKMVASELRMHISPLPHKISTKVQRLYLFLSGSSIPSGLMKILWDQTGRGKIQDVNLSTSFACLCALRQNINGIPTAIPTFLRSSIPLELVGMMCDQTGSGKHKMFRKCETVWLVFLVMTPIW